MRLTKITTQIRLSDAGEDFDKQQKQEEESFSEAQQLLQEEEDLDDLEDMGLPTSCGEDRIAAPLDLQRSQYYLISMVKDRREAGKDPLLTQNEITGWAKDTNTDVGSLTDVVALLNSTPLEDPNSSAAWSQFVQVVRGF